MLNRSAENTWMVVMFVNLLAATLLMVCAFLYSNSVLDGYGENTIQLLSVVLAALFVWFLWSWWMLTRSLFNPYLLFIIAAVLFNAGQAFLEIFHLNANGLLYNDFSPRMVVKTLFLVTLGMVAFHTGGLASVPALRRNLPIRDWGIKGKTAITSARALRLIGWILLAVSVIPAFLVLKDELALTLSSGRSVTFAQEVPTSYASVKLKLAGFMVPGILFLLAGSRDLRFNILLSLIIVLAYSAGEFLAGGRQVPAMLLVAYAWVFHTCVRPLSKKFLFGGAALVLFVVFPAIRATREFGIGERREALKVFMSNFSLLDNPIVASLSEMGWSMSTVAYTLSYVPNYRDFDVGTSYLYAFFGLFPNLFWDYHPTAASGLDRWLVQMAEPTLLLNTPDAALGFSFIAEAYLNFGWFGAPLALGVMGFLLGKLVLWAQRSDDLARVAMVGAFLGVFLLFARGESSTVVRGFGWYSLIPYLGVCALRSLLQTTFHMPGDHPRGSEASLVSRFSAKVDKS